MSALVTNALKTAWNAPFTAPARGYGCGRAYVVFSEPRGVVNAVAAAAKSLGLCFLRKAYGTSGNALYVGYDNASGRELAKAEAVSAALNAVGFRTYVDAVED